MTKIFTCSKQLNIFSRLRLYKTDQIFLRMTRKNNYGNLRYDYGNKRFYYGNLRFKYGKLRFSFMLLSQYLKIVIHRLITLFHVKVLE